MKAKYRPEPVAGRRPASRTTKSYLFPLVRMPQAEVARRCGITSAAVQQIEDRVFRLLKQELLRDPFVLREISPELADRYLPPDAKHAIRSNAFDHHIVGGRALHPKWRQQYLVWDLLAQAYDRDGQPEVAAEIRRELDDLAERLQRLPH